MLPELVADKVRAGLPGCDVSAEGDGSRMRIRVVADAFDGQSRVKRQQLVYGCIDALIADGSLHAVSITALSPAEATAEH
jgi:acid stress-induced BolA-like protein IbaG/YrbA